MRDCLDQFSVCNTVLGNNPVGILVPLTQHLRDTCNTAIEIVHWIETIHRLKNLRKPATQHNTTEKEREGV